MAMILSSQKNYSARICRAITSLALIWGATAPDARAQTFETAGSRALGMGGAFVAVASDSSATWWNPAGIAAGPFIDIALAKSVIEQSGELPAWRNQTSWFALATPPAAFSYYRLRITDIQPFNPTGGTFDSREDRRVGLPVRSLSASQLGVTLVRTLVTGVHAGTTLKYVRGSLRHGREDSLASQQNLLELGDEYEGGDAQSRFDIDVGVLAVVGAIRLGAVVKNVREPEFEAAGLTPDAAAVRLVLPRQVRIGAAFDPEYTSGRPLTLSVDGDVRAYVTATGERRAVAIGGEYWLRAKRLGVRAGGRFNTVGAREKSATAGVTIALRGGLYVDGYAVRGGTADEEGWGLATRVSF